MVPMARIFLPWVGASVSDQVDHADGLSGGHAQGAWGFLGVNPMGLKLSL
jgi:hypothetical protein